MRYFILIFFFFFTRSAFGQIKPDFFPEDISAVNHEAVCYCKPGVVNKSRSRGVSINYGTAYSGNYFPEIANTSVLNTSDLKDFSNLEFKIKVPVFLSEQTKILVGYEYYMESYNFNNISGDFLETINTLDNGTLKSNGFSAIVSHSINEKNYLALRYKFSANGNYAGWLDINGRNAIHNFLGMYGIKKTDLFELGFGLLFSKNFRRIAALPFVLYNRTFSPKWGIEAMFPANTFLRCNINSSTIAIMGIEYNSKSFRIDVENLRGAVPLDIAYNHSELLVSLELERHLRSWIWVNLKVGYQRNFDSEFEAKTDFSPTFQADLEGGLFFQIGAFISPSREEN